MADLKFGPIGENAIHVCVDMQRMFREATQWRSPWMDRILPRALAVCRHNPGRTIFTRFVPPDNPGDGDGSWSRYWNKWSDMTLAKLGPGLVDLTPELAAFVPPGEIVDKRVYSPWISAQSGHSSQRAPLRYADRHRWRNRCVCPCDRVGRCRSRLPRDRCCGRPVQFIRSDTRCRTAPVFRAIFGARRDGRYRPCSVELAAVRNPITSTAAWNLRDSDRARSFIEVQGSAAPSAWTLAAAAVIAA